MAQENYDVPIDVKFTTTGEGEAAKAIEKVSAAGKSAQETGPINTQSVADEVAGMKDQADATRQYALELDAVADLEAKNAAAASDKFDKVAKGLSAAGIAGAAGMAAKTLGSVVEALNSVDTVQLRKLDKELAGQIDNMKQLSKAAEDPIGALLAWIHGESVEDAFKGLNDQLARNMQMHEAQIDRMISKGIKQTDELKRLADAVAAANEILDAKDDADAKARDRADAAAIRGGADKYEVEKKRAEDDAAKEIEKINRDLDAKRPEVQAKFDNAQQAKVNEAAILAKGDATPEQREKAAAEVKAKQLEFEEAKRDFETAKSVAAEQRRGVREGAAGKVEGLTADQAEAAAAEKAKADAAAAKQAADARREAQREELDAKQVKLAGTAAGNKGRIQAGGKKAGGLQEIGGDIGSADTEEEIAAVGEKIRAKQGELGAVTVAALTQMLAGQEQLVKDIETLKKQIRNK